MPGERLSAQSHDGSLVATLLADCVTVFRHFGGPPEFGDGVQTFVTGVDLQIPLFALGEVRVREGILEFLDVKGREILPPAALRFPGARLATRDARNFAECVNATLRRNSWGWRIQAILRWKMLEALRPLWGWLLRALQTVRRLFERR